MDILFISLQLTTYACRKLDALEENYVDILFLIHNIYYIPNMIGI